MKAQALDGENEGVWLRAERQSAGKGRMGRAWLGEEGNLYASTLVRLSPADPPAPSLALVVAVAVHEALSEFTGAGVLILKWPNDVMTFGSASHEGPAKLCGMLLERAGDTVIIGIGVNITTAPDLPDRHTISLRDLGAASCDSAHVLERIAERCAHWLARWRTYGLEPILRAWQARAHPPGTLLAAELPDGTRVSGLYEGLDQSGALILRLADGSRHAMHAGDVFFG